MKTFVCDVCGKSVKNDYELFEILEHLRQEGINDVCADCQDEIIKAKAVFEIALNKIKTSWTKKIILKIKNKYTKSN